MTDDPAAPAATASIDHVTVTAAPAGFAAALACYDAALEALGLVRLAELVDEEEDEASVEAVGWGAPAADPVFWLVCGAVPTTGLHLRLQAQSRVQVESFHGAAVAAGATSRAAPRRWTLYRRGEYGAMVADPAGNLLEAVAPE